MIQKKLEQAVTEALISLGAEGVVFSVEHPTDLSHGDYMTNAALVAAKILGKNPKEVAEALVEALEKEGIEEIDSIEIAGPGFINIKLSREHFVREIGKIISDARFGKTDYAKGEKIIFEYTDPNPFKEFHIGHLMPNAIGEALASIFEWAGADVRRASYQGDVGIHVACAVWAMKETEDKIPRDSVALSEKVSYLGKAYAKGAAAYKDDEKAQKEIRDINKKIFERNDEALNALYDKGRAWSLESFEEMYKRLGTKFDLYFFESEAAPIGLSIVKENVGKVFKESEGAIIFPGEEHGLHTRVFVNKEGLPTYEAKELALASMKFEKFPYDRSVVVTANDIKEYFKVLLSALSQIRPELADKTEHIGHGLLKLPTGKMSSRTGNVITAASLIDQVSDIIRPKLIEHGISKDELPSILDDIAIGAIKFAILRQAIGRDIIFDFEKSLSFEGDSGPYLQYTALRARSVVKKANEKGIEPDSSHATKETSPLERILARLPDVVARAAQERAPQLLVTYLLETASAFNTFYASTQIIGDDTEASYRVALAGATERVIGNGLSMLGIRLPSAM